MWPIGVQCWVVAQFYKAGVATTPTATPTVAVVKNDGTVIVTAGTPTLVDGTNLPGRYKYPISAAVNTLGQPIHALFRTTDTTMDRQDEPSVALVVDWAGTLLATTNSILSAITGAAAAVVSRFVALPLAVKSINAVRLRTSDTGPARSVQLGDAQGRPFAIPDGATVTYRLAWRSGPPGTLPPEITPATIEAAATVDFGDMGFVRFDFSEDVPLPAPGHYNESWIVDDTSSGGDVLTFPGDGYVPVTITEV